MRSACRLTGLACLSLVFLLVGCSPTSMQFESEGASYDAETVTSAAKNDSAAMGKPVEEAVDLRHDALVALRSTGDEGALLANLLTETFPDGERSVPYYAEAASFDGTPAWVIFEVWGSENGTLEHTRVWVFDRETERVLLTAAVD